MKNDIEVISSLLALIYYYGCLCKISCTLVHKCKLTKNSNLPNLTLFEKKEHFLFGDARLFLHPRCSCIMQIACMVCECSNKSVCV